MEYILEIHNLEKKYRNVKVISNVNMNVKKGAIYGIIGKNGAGKTTLMRLICGLQEPTNGTYVIGGISNKDKKIIEMRKRIGAIIETPSIYLDMTPVENLRSQYKMMGLHEKDNLYKLLELVGLSQAEKKKVKNFSLGMKQRLGIAMALVGSPDFIILDEPINGLDPEGIIEIRELILKLNREKGITFLISSHYLDELSKIATDYGFLNKGKIIKEITSTELESSKTKRIEISVSNVVECEKYLEEKNIRYEITSDKKINLYDQINVSELAINLSNRNCIINEFHEKEETLENYYINLIGGEQDA